MRNFTLKCIMDIINQLLYEVIFSLSGFKFAVEIRPSSDPFKLFYQYVVHKISKNLMRRQNAAGSFICESLHLYIDESSHLR